MAWQKSWLPRNCAAHSGSQRQQDGEESLRGPSLEDGGEGTETGVWEPVRQEGRLSWVGRQSCAWSSGVGWAVLVRNSRTKLIKEV